MIMIINDNNEKKIVKNTSVNFSLLCFNGLDVVCKHVVSLSTCQSFHPRKVAWIYTKRFELVPLTYEVICYWKCSIYCALTWQCIGWLDCKFTSPSYRD